MNIIKMLQKIERENNAIPKFVVFPDGSGHIEIYNKDYEKSTEMFTKLFYFSTIKELKKYMRENN